MFDGASMRAGGTIYRARFVKHSTAADFTVLQCTANARVYGVSQEAGREAPLPAATASPPVAASSGDSVKVIHRPGDICYVEIGSGGITRGATIESDADGKGVAAGTTAATRRYIGAIALESASEGELCRVELAKYVETIPAS